MGIIDVIALVLALGLFGLLVWAMLKPERF